ncbi:DUF2953 family protein [Kineothrix alysoides]|uniref:DUF2953 family protein n=1 Tax=Kineothrix alysoides TaxID=1469948 RepID=A0A4R1QZN7_9FIRM|nr:DUF2953 domain-containing protein [Kineothrix alysoides]TCL58475.1 DUF2953 family protein [Kineothrix alysoides]
MLHIVLLILKIIGVILAVLLGILLLAICLVLFVPVRYRIQADGKLGEDEPLRVRVKITWLLHILNALLTCSKAVRLRVRIFFFTLFDSSKPKKEKAEKKREIKKEKREKKAKKGLNESKNKNKDILEENVENKAEENQDNKSDREIQSKEQNEIQSKAENKSENKIEGKQKIPEKAIENNAIGNDSAKKDNVREDVYEKDEGVGDSTESEKKSGLLEKLRAAYFKIIEFFRKIIDFLRKLLEIIRNIEYTITAICDKIKKIIEDIGYYTELLQGEVFKEAFGISKKQLFRIIRSIRPRKCDVRLTVGTGDPASTGQILAIYGMLYPFIGNNVRIQADFENMIVEGSLDIRGRVTAFTLLIAAFRLYRDKNIKQLLKLLKREDS